MEMKVATFVGTSSIASHDPPPRPQVDVEVVEGS